MTFCERSNRLLERLRPSAATPSRGMPTPVMRKPATAAQTQYDTLFGEVVSAAADERAFVTGRWQFDDDKLNTLHHLGTGNFVASGRHVRANSLDE